MKLFSKIKSNPLKPQETFLEPFDYYQFSVKDYLQSESNYAFLIFGDWGSGKTFYYKTKLVPIINNTDVRRNASLKYKSIRISLYGIKSIEDLYNSIWLEVNPVWKKKSMQIGLALTKTIARASLQIKYGIRDFDKYIDDSRTAIHKTQSYEQLVICFDDLERISTDFKLKEVFGFINNLVENNDIKIIIIANYDKLEYEDKKELIEKTIGRKIEYKPNIELDIESIINLRFNNTGQNVFANFLTKNKDIIIEIIKSGNTNNYRDIIYGLSFFEKYFYFLNLRFHTDINNDLWTKMLRSLLGITLSLSIELRNHDLKASEINGLRDSGFGSIYFSGWSYDGQSNEAKELEEPYENKFFKNYKSDLWTYYLYPNVLDVLLGSKMVNVDSIIENFDLVFKPDDELPRKLKLLKDIQYGKYHLFTEVDIKNIIYEILDNLSNGEYQPVIIQEIFCKLAYFRDVLDYSLQYIYEKCRSSISVYFKKGNYYFDNMELGEYIYSEPLADIKELHNDLKNYSEYINHLIDVKYNNLTSIKIIEDSLENINTLIENIELKYPSPFLHYEPEKFYKLIISLNNEDLWRVTIALQKRYMRFHDFKQKEFDFLEYLKININDEIIKEKNGMRKHMLDNILKHIGPINDADV